MNTIATIFGASTLAEISKTLRTPVSPLYKGVLGVKCNHKIEKKMDKMKEKGVALLTTAVDEHCSVILIYAGEEHGVVVVHGNSVDLCAAMHTCFEAYKTGVGTTSQKAFADMVLDVISVNFTPDQMVKEMDKRINELI